MARRSAGGKKSSSCRGRLQPAFVVRLPCQWRRVCDTNAARPTLSARLPLPPHRAGVRGGDPGARRRGNSRPRPADRRHTLIFRADCGGVSLTAVAAVAIWCCRVARRLEVGVSARLCQLPIPPGVTVALGAAQQAIEFAGSAVRIVLVDGAKLADLMIEYEVGVASRARCGSQRSTRTTSKSKVNVSDTSCTRPDAPRIARGGFAEAAPDDVVRLKPDATTKSG